ncbi:MAG TPA: cobalamin-dependent protein [Bryobacteraceae bacterium]|nr:cobalamin-dependent protein [Bryobacteraceae bacterium]
MSRDINLERSRSVADLIRANRTLISERVAKQFLRRHPVWIGENDEWARRWGAEDAGVHQDILAAAIEAGEVEAFNSYMRWAKRMLSARHVGTTSLIDTLHNIGAALLDLAPAEDHPLIQRFVRSGVAACGESELRGEPTGTHTDSLVSSYVEAALRGRRQAAIELLLEAAQHDYTLPKLYEDVLQPAMYRIGALWETNEITVAQEHMATAITQYAMAQLYPLIRPAGPVKGNVLITGVEGEQHQLGANMVADMLEMDGWNVHFLGADTPAESVVAAAGEYQANVVGISATMLFNLLRVRDLIQRLRETDTGKDVKIIVGGSAFRHAPQFAREIGADAYAFDLASAVAAVNRISAARGCSSDGS